MSTSTSSSSTSVTLDRLLSMGYSLDQVQTIQSRRSILQQQQQQSPQAPLGEERRESMTSTASSSKRGPQQQDDGTESCANKRRRSSELSWVPQPPDSVASPTPLSRKTASVLTLELLFPQDQGDALLQNFDMESFQW